MQIRMRGPLLAVRGVACAAALVCASATASHVGEELAMDQQAAASSTQLIAVLRQYERAPEAQRAAILQRLAQLAEQRRARLLQLLEHNPKLAAARILPARVRERLPAAARAFAEQETSATGIVTASIADDIEHQRTRQRLELLDEAGRRLELRIANASEREQLALVGKRASVTAMRLDRQLLVLDKRGIRLAAADGTTASSTGTASPPLVQGEQTTLVIAGHFTDKPLACGTADLQDRLFGAGPNTLDQGYRESSGGLVSFSGRVLGPFPIGYASTGGCDYNGWASALRSAALAAGFNPAAYKRVSYVLPPNASCGWSGLATLGGTSPTPSWVLSCGSTGLFTHELGHNLKFHHAATATSEYGDGSDAMGRARLVQSNAPNRVMAGWLGGSQLLDVAGGGSYALAALEAVGATSPQVLRLYKADTSEYYYVSLRQAGGVDVNLEAAYRDVLSVHRSTGALPAKTYLVATIPVGQSWSDGVNGVQLTHQALSGSTATVGVALNGPSCSRQAPTLALSPSSQSAAPGAGLAYAVTVRNNNSAACPTAVWALSQALPAGFTGSFGTSSVTLASGASAEVAWNVASSTSSPDADYTLTAAATDAAAGGRGEAHASYVVLAPLPPPPAPPPPPPTTDTTPPGVVITSPGAGASLSGRQAAVSAQASDAGGVRVVEFYADGKLIGSDSTAPYAVNWNLRKAGRGAHTLRARAIDSAGNAAEQALSVTVN